MDVVVVGGHGQVAQRLLRMLAARGDRARGVIRNPDHADDLQKLGAEAVICDIETEDLTDAVAGADAVVFAAGAGPGSGTERKRTVDYGGAVKLIEAAKAQADAALEASGLDYTIVRPGGLTDDPGTGRIAAATRLDRGQIPREDVAATVVAVLDTPSTIGKGFDLVGGDIDIQSALKGV